MWLYNFEESKMKTGRHLEVEWVQVRGTSRRCTGFFYGEEGLRKKGAH